MPTLAAGRTASKSDAKQQMKDFIDSVIEKVETTAPRRKQKSDQQEQVKVSYATVRAKRRRAS